MTDPVFQLFSAPQSGKGLTLPQNSGVSNSNGGKAESAILSFSSVYRDVALLLRNSQDALGEIGEQLSAESDVQQQAGSLSDGVNEQTLIGQLLGLVEGNPNHQDSNGGLAGEGADTSLKLSELDELNPIIPTDDVLKSLPVAHSGVNNLQDGPERHETVASLIVSIAGSYTTSVQSPSSISKINSFPSHQSPEPLLPQRPNSAPLAQSANLVLNQQQGVTAPDRDTTNVIQSLEKLGSVNDQKSERLVPQPSPQLAQRLVPFDSQIDKVPQASGPVDPSLVRNQRPVSPVSVLGNHQQAVPSPLTINGSLNPISAEGTQGLIGAESESRLGSASIKSVQISQGEVGSSGSETFSGQHPNGGMAPSADSHQGNSPNMNQGQSQTALRGNTFEERLQAYNPTAPQRLQIDVQLSETARVQVDVSVQQRQVYAGLLMDQPILRNLALQHVSQLETQLNQNEMELQEFDVQVDQQEKGQREVFEDGPQAFRFGSEPENAPVDYVKKDLDMASDRERGLHFVA